MAADENDLRVAEHIGSLNARVEELQRQVQQVAERHDDAEKWRHEVSEKLSLTRTLWLIAKALAIIAVSILTLKFGDIKTALAMLKTL